MNRNTDHDLPANNNLFSKKKKKKQFVIVEVEFFSSSNVYRLKLLERRKEYNFFKPCIYLYIYISPVCRSARRDGIALTTDTLTHSPSRRATGFSSTHVTNRVSIEGTITRSSSVEGVSEVSC